MIKAIETQYNGYRFRSRLEARWAVYFDAMGIEYEYEPEGFNTGFGNYLPDFFLPGINAYVEIKGNNAFSISETDDGVVFENGREEAEKYVYAAIEFSKEHTFIILQGDPVDTLLHDHGGNGRGDVFFTGLCTGSVLAEHCDDDIVAYCGDEKILCKDCTKNKEEMCHASFCGFTDTECFYVIDRNVDFLPKDSEHFNVIFIGKGLNNDELEWVQKNIKSAKKARQARFEYGEKG